MHFYLVFAWFFLPAVSLFTFEHIYHGLRTPREEKAFTARLKIQSQSQIFRYGRSIFCLPHQLNFSDIFDLCLHWVSVVRDIYIAKGGQNFMKSHSSIGYVPYRRHYKPLSLISRGIWVLKKFLVIQTPLQYKL
jgi:hypothetical protein